MEDNLKSKLGFTLFFLLIIGLLVGGFFYTKYTINSKKNIPKNDLVLVEKIDNDKDYIYYINEEVISEEGKIYYKDVVINLKNQTTLNDSLEKENKIYKDNIKYISDMNILSKELITYNYNNIYAVTFRDYSKYEYDKYISLLIKDYNYSCFDGVTYNGGKAYVFDTSTGELINEDDLLNLYGKNIDSVKEKISNYLSGKQTKVNGVNVINIEETINNISTNSLFINEYGKLSISYLVKTTQTDYNEITEVG